MDTETVKYTIGQDSSLIDEIMAKLPENPYGRCKIILEIDLNQDMNGIGFYNFFFKT